MATHGPKAAWRHNDGDSPYTIGLRTNANLCRFLAMIGRRVSLDGKGSEECGVLYGNACFFLQEGNGSPDRGAAASKPVFEFVISKMPRLKAIGCLGKCAFDGAMSWLELPNTWRAQIDARKPVRYKNLLIFALAHPGQRGINNRVQGAVKLDPVAEIEADWRALGRALRRVSRHQMDPSHDV
ncbi:hypothetical protein FJ417_03320 [Mesorhizobium sp. B3-1-7]|uniref:hypothetical protein n=1 Tax=Mesorhizobium sp. B3-1-7 TaxID=2589894 RepID=UPI001129574E|nr:hypothetical protein [Mesorhizobium sp. B3-1-7]TPI63946.1 hypothetical protein FJ417_03320 [Mesorhizobium sp. B3-1-7]